MVNVKIKQVGRDSLNDEYTFATPARGYYNSIEKDSQVVHSDLSSLSRVTHVMLQ